MEKRKKKGITVYALIVVLCVSINLLTPYLPHFAFLWGSPPDAEDEGWKAQKMDYVAAETAVWIGLAEADYPEVEQETYPGSEKGLLFHNNGQFMDCDFIVSAGGCRLVGVYCFKFWGQVPVESYYFSDKPFADEESLLAWILTEQYSHSTPLMGRGFDFQAKYFAFAFLDEEDGVESSLTTRVQAEKEWENVNINGTPGGTKWLVWMRPEMETAASRGVSAFSTLLDVNDENQELMHWEPFNSTSPKVTISFSTSGGISREEHYDELPLNVDSSMSGNYCKWMYDLPRMPQWKLSMLPSVEVTNLDDVLVIELQHTAVVNTGIFRKEELDTGRIRIEFSDVPTSESDK